MVNDCGKLAPSFSLTHSLTQTDRQTCSLFRTIIDLIYGDEREKHRQTNVKQNMIKEESYTHTHCGQWREPPHTNTHTVSKTIGVTNTNW